MKVQKFDSRVVEVSDSTPTYEWTTGEMEYSLVYDNDGDLLGVEITGISQNILNDIVERPYSYDFPTTLNEYKSLL